MTLSEICAHSRDDRTIGLDLSTHDRAWEHLGAHTPEGRSVRAENPEVEAEVAGDTEVRMRPECARRPFPNP